MSSAIETDRNYFAPDSALPRDAACKSILLADDDSAMLELLCLRLSEEGFEVHTVGTGVELMRALEQLSLETSPAPGVDLIIADLRMPQLTGLDAMRRLRADHWDLPAILMTAFPNTLVRIEAEKLGITLIAKPFPLQVLVRTARHLLTAADEGLPAPHAFRSPPWEPGAPTNGHS
ncbi:MAG: response regulator [Pseudomonadota bacterium]